jgi:hypothetical protein
MSSGSRCGLPLHPPDGRYWLPSRDPEPGPEVQAVALCGQDPAILRCERTSGGWRFQGVAAVPHCTPPKPWYRVGHCWDSCEHPVYDVTSSPHRA